jgi:hypothetical protein
MTESEFKKLLEYPRNGIVESRRIDPPPPPPIGDGDQTETSGHLISPERWIKRGLVDGVMTFPVFGIGTLLMFFVRSSYEVRLFGIPLSHLQTRSLGALLWLVLTFGGTLGVNWLCRVEPAEVFFARVKKLMLADDFTQDGFTRRLWRMSWRLRIFRYWLWLIIGPLTAIWFIWGNIHDDGFIDRWWFLPVMWASIGWFISAFVHYEEVVMRPPQAPKGLPFGDPSMSDTNELDRAGL